MAIPQDRQSPRTGTAPQIAEVAAEVAAAMAYLEAVSVRLHSDADAGQRDAAAIPASTLVALRRSCQLVARHSHRALVVLCPQRAAAAKLAAAHIREVETLRFGGR